LTPQLRVHLLTLFPEFFRGPLECGVVAKAIQSGLIAVQLHNLRNWTYDVHKTVDDRPFGGGEGMLMKIQPIDEALQAILPDRNADQKVVLLSASGKKFDQAAARRLAEASELLLICGRYEGVDERVAEHLCDEELSIGDYVLSGGELGACVIVDAVSRLLPGVLGNSDSAVNESFTQADQLDCPQYTRPAEYKGWKAPEVLLGGNHAEIKKWRRAAAEAKTRRNRPDLLD
jgi:tRNA (guanine37-N1)-methyltransferase